MMAACKNWRAAKAYSPRAAARQALGCGAVKPPRSVLARDAVIFMLKLWLDGLKDVALTTFAIGALALDLTVRRGADRDLFYRVVRAGEKFDLWLNLYGAADASGRSDEGFFGASRSGEDTFLGKLEEMTGGERSAGKRR